jgi:hypothetical protein
VRSAAKDRHVIRRERRGSLRDPVAAGALSRWCVFVGGTPFALV